MQASSTASPQAAVPRQSSHEPRVSGILGAALLCACLFATFPLPTALVSPLPLILQRLRGGWVRALLASGLSLAVALSIFDVRQTLRFLILLVAPGLALGDAMARGRGLRQACLRALLVVTLGMSLHLLISGDHMAETVFFKPISLFRSSEFLDQMRAAGLPPERVDVWVADWDEKRDALKVVYPAAFVMLSWIVVLVNASLVRAYLARRDPGWLEGGEFEGMRWPPLLSVGFVAAGLLVLLVPARPFAYNILLLLGFLFGLQGLAVVFYYVHRLAGPSFLRVIVVVAILGSSWAPRILSLVGLFDLFLDFRKYAAPPPTREQS